MRIIILIPVLIVAACSKGAAEEKRYAIVERGAIRDSHGQLCTQAQKVSAGYLADGNEEKYKQWQAKILSECS